MSDLPARGSDSANVLARLRELRASDAPTHGGKVLAYVYDSGLPELDELAHEAAELARPLNGLDPTVFPSIAAMERDLVAFVRRALGGEPNRRFGGRRQLGGPVVGSITSGGTESCLLAVKTARDLWRAARTLPDEPHRASSRRETAGSAGTGRGTHPRTAPRLVAPATVHAAFHKAARMFDLQLDLVPCQPDGSVRAHDVIARLGDDVALVVLSAPAYPSGALDPIAQVSQAALAQGVPLHVDACFGGLAMPWWPGTPEWDFRLPGVTSISADLHKFGYAPKGVSALLHRGRVRHRKQFFAVASWPGYPVVNPTLLGSRSASPLAASWAIVQRLGAEGYRELTASIVRSAEAIECAVSGDERTAWVEDAEPHGGGLRHTGASRVTPLGATPGAEGIVGLTVWGHPTGPAIALVADERLPPEQRVDPHLLADEVARLGFKIQHQPGLVQSNGVRLPHSAHLTLTPVTERTLPELLATLRRAADAVRGKPRPSVGAQLAALRLLGYSETHVPGPAAAWKILRIAGAAPRRGQGGLQQSAIPARMAPLMRLVEEAPAPVAEALLTELLARVGEP